MSEDAGSGSGGQNLQDLIDRCVLCEQPFGAPDDDTRPEKHMSEFHQCI